MKYLYKKRGFRGTEGERSHFVFFTVGAVVLLAVAFVLGIQVGRVIEKKAAQRKSEADKVAGPIEIRKETESEIRKDLGVFAEDAGKVPPVAPPSAGERLNETEKSLTFRETLAKKEPEPILLVKPRPEVREPEAEAQARSAPAHRLMVQAAALRDRKAAESFRKRLEKGGFKASVVQGKPGDFHKVMVGPFPDRDAAERAIRKLRSEWNVKAFLVRG